MFEKPEGVCLYTAKVGQDGSDLQIFTVAMGLIAPGNTLFKHPLRLIRQEKAGPAAARNHAARLANGKYLAFTDDDCCPATDWLSMLDTCFTKEPKHIVGGRTINTLPKNPYSTTSQNIISIGYDHYNAIREQARFFASNNMVIPTDRFLELSGFDDRFTTSEDRELCDRWIHQGYKMTYSPEVIIYHAHPMTLCSFWRQHFSYGQGAFRFHKTRQEKGWGNFQIEGNYYLNLLPYPFINGQGKQGLILIAVLLISQLANAAGFFWAMMQYNRLNWSAPISANDPLQSDP